MWDLSLSPQLTSLQTNCISEPLFQTALDHARRLDNYLKTQKKLIGPLHGIPISVKDQFHVKGVDTTLGYVGRSFKPSSDAAVMVTILENLGAIIIAKTAIPQSIMYGETESPLWGLTTYPGRPELSPGGSSGGEGALMAMSGSLGGWGTDIGGSIRVCSYLRSNPPTSENLLTLGRCRATYAAYLG